MAKKRLAVALVVLTGALALGARQKEPVDEYAGRRDRLLERVNAPVVLFGHGGRENTAPDATFWQEPNFYYLTGHDEPGTALLLVPQTEEAKAAGLPGEILFLPPRDKARERWVGVKLGPADPDAPAQTGFAVVKPVGALRGELEQVLEIFPAVYTLFPLPTPENGPAGELSHAGRWYDWLRAVAPLTEFRDVRSVLGGMRQVKSESELSLLRFSIEQSMEAHRAAMGALRPGVYEYELAALMERSFAGAGCERPGYPPIVGSGFNSTVLHYDANRREMPAGDLVVIDVAGECNGYTADITRTLPVSGKFTERQREIYQIVLAAQNAALEAVRPGMTLSRTGENSLYRIAYDYINTHGTDQDGEPLGQYFIHGLGHHIGLEVHDAGPRGRLLEPGMIFTIEPGIYLPEESLGVRIEDIVLVTEDGYELLTAALPRTVEKIEELMSCNQPNLPNPVIEITRAEQEMVLGQEIVRYWLTVSNWSEFPDQLFEPSPDLPPCERNKKAARTWVDIYAEDGRRVYGFCALDSAAGLTRLWFAVQKDELPPERVYITLKDRRCQKTYQSNLASTAVDIE
ncbi:MAG: Xaa-Pro peptidase family protein [Candidatus Acidoferrales bacterium]